MAPPCAQAAGANNEKTQTQQHKTKPCINNKPAEPNPAMTYSSRLQQQCKACWCMTSAFCSASMPRDQHNSSAKHIHEMMHRLTAKSMRTRQHAQGQRPHAMGYPNHHHVLAAVLRLPACASSYCHHTAAAAAAALHDTYSLLSLRAIST